MNTAQRIIFSAAAVLCLSACASPRPTAETPSCAPSATPPRPQDVVVHAYPLRNQTTEQQDRDRYECHLWAVKQSAFDPSSAGLPQRTHVQFVDAPDAPSSVPAATASGLVLGAIIGGSHDSGVGAAVGAVSGALIGALTDAQRAELDDEANKERSDAQRARNVVVEQKTGDYRRAISTCFAGRGYRTQ